MTPRQTDYFYPRQPGPILGWPESQVIMSCQHSNGPLLTRYYLFSSGPLAVFLHHLQASDEDRALHDHPWSFISILLTGGYYEWTMQGRFWRPWLSILFRPAEWLHRIQLVRPVWTLVFRFRRRRIWGFLQRWYKGDSLHCIWQDHKTYGRELCD